MGGFTAQICALKRECDRLHSVSGFNSHHSVQGKVIVLDSPWSIFLNAGEAQRWKAETTVRSTREKLILLFSISKWLPSPCEKIYLGRLARELPSGHSLGTLFLRSHWVIDLLDNGSCRQIHSWSLPRGWSSSLRLAHQCAAQSTWQLQKKKKCRENTVNEGKRDRGFICNWPSFVSRRGGL